MIARFYKDLTYLGAYSGIFPLSRKSKSRILIAVVLGHFNQIGFNGCSFYAKSGKRVSIYFTIIAA
ncbi:hypothetical protein AHMF7605_18720 [Adhaeribacter arboris]|uniref:Uncharacterized protein n=1 Tax=Adhaeribacter arboris TaxID=2072846 RepID=A0A2T2YIR2_9BACT|nr:hypothetical protein AHMF7605_18720 [Adhaeribacter arboris]